jgi:hypothetical protein
VLKTELVNENQPEPVNQPIIEPEITEAGSLEKTEGSIISDGDKTDSEMTSVTDNEDDTREYVINPEIKSVLSDEKSTEPKK